MSDDLPVILQPEPMLDWLIERGSPLTGEEWGTASGYVGRNHAPYLLLGLRDEGLIPADVLPRATVDAWEMAESPEGCADTSDWVELFNEIGYTVNGEPALPPTEPLTLYRGATEETYFGMSWTDSPEQAQWFADRIKLVGGRGEVFKCVWEPWDILARIHAPGHGGRGEHEYVCDPPCVQP